jgi:hypothetical protein
MRTRRFPPPWTAEDIGDCFVVKASNERSLVFIYYGEGVGRRSLARLLTRDIARRRHREAAVIVGPEVIGSIRVAKHCSNPKCLIPTLARHHGFSQKYHHLTAVLFQ